MGKAISHRPPNGGAVCLCCYFTPSPKGRCVFAVISHRPPGGRCEKTGISHRPIKGRCVIPVISHRPCRDGVLLLLFHTVPLKLIWLELKVHLCLFNKGSIELLFLYKINTRVES